ncbi:hypothetical protein [Halapricum hydrolyticum]|uniref:Uncharacterized protein n=1 Tax=Halapricum hydrolyticum TaxID=2979991 RepID=A0AAE3LK52_9EURY|nr:hypothetical protein [Halapricum hydrolyticum]MCU4719039.1 hypothetical protein [Halapricum hydrolyticum]MCU4728028.1 hypothetical protein [Halapricum hydrolyticum]
MSSKLGYVEIALGTAITFGGTVQILISMEETTQVLLWGAAVLIGLFVLAYGVVSVMNAGGSEEAADPNKAISKTDSRFGRG